MSFHRGEKFDDYISVARQNEFAIELSTAQIEAIEAKRDSKVLEYSEFDKYPLYKQAYDYIIGRFPSCADEVKSLPLLECSRETLRLTGRALGVDMAAGFYIPSIDAMVVSRHAAKIKYTAYNREQKLALKLHNMRQTSDPPIDVILVHELLHFIYKLKNGNGKHVTRIANENFAYTETIPYLRECDWTDEEIATQYLNVWSHMMVFGDGKYLESKFSDYGTTKAKYSVMEYEDQMELMVKIMSDSKEEMDKAIHEYAYNMIREFDIKYGNKVIEYKEESDYKPEIDI